MVLTAAARLLARPLSGPRLWLATLVVCALAVPARAQTGLAAVAEAAAAWAPESDAASDRPSLADALGRAGGPQPTAETPSAEARRFAPDGAREGEAVPLDVLGMADAGLVADTTDDIRERPTPLTVFGYYRVLFYGRDFGEPYPNLEPFERAYGVGDGYREPMLSVNVLGRPNGRSAFGTELFVFSPYDGQYEENAAVSLNLGVNFYGTFRTEAGSFGVRAGGIHWYNLSPFTIGVYQVLNRYSVFDRTPWEGVNGIAKYTNYFETGQANPGDERFDFQAFQGLILTGDRLPGGLGFDAFWGKTQPNGGLPGAATELGELGPGDTPTYRGFSGQAAALPSFIGGGQLRRAFAGGDLVGPSSLALNTIASYRTLDSLSGDTRRYQVHSAEFATSIGGVGISGELGASLFDGPGADLQARIAGDPTATTPIREWGEALMARVATPSSLTRVPLEVQVYQVGRWFFNENGEIATNNNPQLRADPQCAVPAGGGSIGGLITQVGQLAHNRRGVNVTTELDAGPASLGVGWGLAHELASTTTDLSYVHRINGLAMSRVYNPFPAEAVCATQFGPLARQFSFFRGVFERVELTDVDPVTGFSSSRKYFHAVDLSAKGRARVLGRDAFLFYLASFGSANRVARPLPTDDDTYLFVQYHEIDAYVELVPGFVLTGYAGIENARGGRFTEADATTNRTRDQLATGFGVGFDWSVASNAGLYLRHRWMDFEDRAFPEDTYQGQETTLELKVFF